MTSISHMDVKFLWGNSNYDYVCSESLGNSGGILCIWEASIFKKINTTVSDNFIAIYGTWLPTNSKILFIAIYAPQQTSCKRKLWDYISNIVGRWNGESIIMGDFNEVRSSEEQQSTQQIPLQNSGFETRPTNLSTNATSEFVLLDASINVIPGWSYNGTVRYVTSGGNVSLPGNGHGMQLGPNGMINQTFKPDDSYDYVLTFTLASSSAECANNSTAVNVSGPSVSKVFFFEESLGNETWQTRAYSLGWSDFQTGSMSVQIQSVVNSSRGNTNTTCWPIIDTLLVTGIQTVMWYSGIFCPDIILTDVPTPLNFLVTDNGFVNSGFEVGPAFIENSSQGILLDGDPKIDPFNRFQPPFHSVQSPLQEWSILGIVKYIDSKHHAVPRGRGAVELVSGNPSGIVYNIYFFKHGQTTIDFIMGDANNSCVGDFVVYLQVENTIWNFTMRSIGVGSREKHSVTFKAEFSKNEWVPVSFYSYNETRTSNHQVLCGPVIDSTVIRFSSGLHSEYLHRGFLIFSFLLAVTFPFLL
ncbi:lysine--tRNA ligase, cytoplasmic-like protein [Tanacetum coccineum]